MTKSALKKQSAPKSQNTVTSKSLGSWEEAKNEVYPTL